MKKHNFHMVENSPWPILVSFAVLFTALGGVMYMHFLNQGLTILLCSLGILVVMMNFWFRDVVREGTFLKEHSEKVMLAIRFGFLLFIVSEVMFFFSFFWAFFHSSLAPSFEIGSVWPPFGMQVFSPWEIPLLNTVILLSSGATITLVHMAILANNRNLAIEGFIATLALAILFTGIQMYEYFQSPFSFSDGIYGSVFFMMTGFHGIHVIIGTIFILVQLFRYLAYHFTKKNHFGFEAAAWYWHFVDVVWLFLFVSIYIWGNWTSN
ncbi:cytochrome c oxidase subunit 3 [bacterium]|nr:MAG: cytochrome c oxidase subunit 3 [bacterium]